MLKRPTRPFSTAEQAVMDQVRLKKYPLAFQGGTLRTARRLVVAGFLKEFPSGNLEFPFNWEVTERPTPMRTRRPARHLVRRPMDAIGPVEPVKGAESLFRSLVLQIGLVRAAELLSSLKNLLNETA